MSVYSDFEDGDRDFAHEQYRSSRKHNKPMGPDAPHLPNKAERKELTRIMQASGLSEEEVRKDLTHRRSLAKASKSMSQSPGKTDRYRHAQKHRARVLARLENIPIWEAQQKVGLK